MTYKQAMRQKCSCGKEIIGGWIGSKRKGRPNFSRVSFPQVIYPTLVMCEEHTLNACYAPQKIA